MMIAAKFIALNYICLQLHCAWCQKMMYPSVYWKAGSTSFKKCPNHAEIAVLPESKLSIICPSIVALAERTSRDQTLEKDWQYESVYEVNEEDFKKCQLSPRNSSANKVLMKCDQQTTLIHHTLSFSKDVKGMSFYFISTSNGKMKSTESLRIDCVTDNLKMKIYVCQNNTDSRCQSESIQMWNDRLPAKNTSDTLCYDGFWMGFACGIWLLFVYSMVVNIMLFLEIRSCRKVKPCQNRAASTEDNEPGSKCTVNNQS